MATQTGFLAKNTSQLSIAMMLLTTTFVFGQIDLSPVPVAEPQLVELAPSQPIIQVSPPLQAPVEITDSAAGVVVNKFVERSHGRKSELPLPSSLTVAEYEAKLFKFLNDREYMELGWDHDKSMRDTGPYINGKYYGTHPAVRVFYSPEVIVWLMQGRKGPLPDGAMICKEQYEEPAARHDGKTEEELRKSLKSWTVMVKDSKGSHDGWFWSNPGANQEVTDNHEWPFDHPLSGFGHYCVRCHAATHSPGADAAAANNEFTFSSLRNIEGFPGEPIVFRVDDSWREEAHEGDEPQPSEKLAADNPTEKLLNVKLDAIGAFKLKSHDSHPRCTQTNPPEQCKPHRNESFLKFYGEIGEQVRKDVAHLPPVTHDWAPRSKDPKQQFVTSNQCMSCHAGLVAPFGPSMFVPTGESAGYGEPGWHISPYGEWRWTPMGLAGRDPIFYSQVESEIELLKKQFPDDLAKAKKIGENLVNTCLRCHGAMGKHQFDVDHAGEGKKFTMAHMMATAKGDEHLGLGDSRYGALGRDGISCMVCHRSQPREQPEGDDRPYLQFFLENSITGNFHLGKDNEIYGPFKDDELSPYVMEHGIGIKPKHSEYLKSSQMCGTCHTVNLPIVDHPFEGPVPEEQKSLVESEKIEDFKKFHHHIEQATYLEWLNSQYENEFNTDNPNAKSCQDCHMSKELHDDENDIHLESLATRIAAVQDRTYPDAENLAELEELNIRMREKGFARHNFAGLNMFLVELFNQFDDILGVRKHDFMTGSKIDLQHSLDNFMQTARNDVADMTVEASMQDGRLVADVNIVNKVGHRFPSGVGFRRAFIELLVTEESEESGKRRLVWSSGRTNELGVIIGPDGEPLCTEFFERLTPGADECYQPHHEIIS
ncbi:MAG: cytochrome P460 family protein, partial [Planctomycetota bacterium]